MKLKIEQGMYLVNIVVNHVSATKSSISMKEHECKRLIISQSTSWTKAKWFQKLDFYYGLNQVPEHDLCKFRTIYIW